MSVPPDAWDRLATTFGERRDLGEPAPRVEFTGDGYPLRLRAICAYLLLGIALGVVLVRGAYWLAGVIA